MIVFPVRIIMSPTSSSRPLAGRNARSAKLRTKRSLPRGPRGCRKNRRSALPGNERRGYATRPSRLKREPSPLLAQTGQHHDVDAPPALMVASAHDALLGKAEALRQRAGGGVVRCRGDLDPVERQRGEGPVHEQPHGRAAGAAAAGGGDEPV